MFFLDLRFAESESVLDPNGELLLKWKVDYYKRKIRFQLIISEKAPAFNWFALGFSDRGKLINSDVCLFWTDYTSRNHFEVTKTISICFISRFINRNSKLIIVYLIR